MGEDKRGNNLEEIVSRYGKMGMIIILTSIVIFLLFYLLNQKKSNEVYNLQGSNEQIIKSVPEYLYVVESSDIFKKNEIFKTDEDNPSQYKIREKNEVGRGKSINL